MVDCAIMWFLLSACSSPEPVRAPPATGDTPSDPAPTTASAPTDGTDPAEDPCPDGPGSACDPFVADPLPYVDARDSADSPFSRIDRYGCDPDIDESGPEWWYTVTLTTSGVLSAAIDEVAGDDVDVDVHLLSSTDPEDCLARDHVGVVEFLDPGTYLVVVDTWTDDAGVPQSGPYTLTVGFTAFGDDPCATVPTDVRMFWSSCDPSVPDCFRSGGEVYLATPTIGPVVKEAHLVTDGDGFGGGWPDSFTDRLDAHYALSEATTGFSAERTEPWAPAGEGGSEYGQGATGVPLPVEDEAWYLNMYWRDRPEPGTRFVVRNPANGRAVVAAGGYETGPGANDSIAGVVEEVHLSLGTGHRDDLEIGFAADQNLPLGPIACR